MYRRRFRTRRRGRYHPRRWRRWRRGWYRRRRRPGRRVGWRRIWQHEPRRHKHLYVRGWEPLGNVCATDSVKAEATPYYSVEPQGGAQSTAVWHGTWGKHYLTFNNLLQRAQARWCLFSSDWESYDYVLFLGGTIFIPQTSHIAWMINFDEYLQTKMVRYNEKNKEDHWGHPGILINTPHTHMIFPPWNYRHQRMYRIKIRPPPGWQGVQRFPEAMSYICLHWLWTWFDPEHAFYDVYCQSGTTSTCEQAPWWANNTFVAGKWVDRTLYDDPVTNCNAPENKYNWGPFLPQKISSAAAQTSLFFLYKLKFKLVGNAIWRAVPRNFQAQGMVPDPEGPNQSSVPARDEPKTGESRKKRRKRPLDEADIWAGDLDSDGILTERALRRITGHCPGDEQPPLEKRLKSLHDKLHRIISDRGLVLRK
nr:ORF1 [Torque teno felis virus]